MSKQSIEIDGENTSSASLNKDVSENGVLVKSMLTRIYTRDDMLKIKDLEASKKDIGEGSVCTNSKVLCKILKPSCKILDKFLRPQYTSGIVLGPQKRTWNTGCHVTQSKRLPNEYIRGNKGQNEGKFVRGEFKRDNRGNSSRYYAGNNGGFNRGNPQPKESNQMRGRASDSFNESEAEPEWFTEGPETVNDTVELGMSIDDNGEFKPIEKNSPPGKDNTTAVSISNPSEVDSAILSIDRDLLLSPREESSKISEVTESDLLKLFNIPKKKSSEGSLVLKLLNDSNDNSMPSSSSHDNAQFVFKFPVTNSDEKPSVSNFHPQISKTTSEPPATDLSSMFRDLVLHGSSSSLPIDVPKVSTNSTLLSSVPTLEQIETTTLAKGMSGNLQKHASNLSQGPLDQAPRGRSILVTLGLKDNLSGLSRPQGFDSYTPHQSSLSKWGGSSFSNNNQGKNVPIVSSSGDGYQLGDQFLRMGDQVGYDQRSQMTAGRHLPNDPAIATAIPQRRAPPPNPPRFDLEQALLAVQSRQRQQQFGTIQQHPPQQTTFLPHQNYRSGIQTSNLHPSVSVEASLSQMRASLGALQHRNPSTPPNSTFSSTVTIRGSGNNSSTKLDQYQQSTTASHGGGNGFSVMMDNFLHQSQQQPLNLFQQPRSQQYPLLRHNGSAPTLLPPPVSNANNSPNDNSSGGFDMFLCNYDNTSYFSRQRKRLS